MAPRTIRSLGAGRPRPSAVRGMMAGTPSAAAVAALALAGTARADIPLVEGENQNLAFYGFLKADLVWQEDDMNSKYAPRFARDDGSSSR